MGILQRVRWWTGVAIFLLFVAAILTAMSAPAAAQGEGTARILGRVTDGAGNAVAGATVVLVAEGTGAPARRTTTGETGGFEFAGLAAGRYTVRAEREGRSPREERVELEAGERATVVTRLSPGRAGRRTYADAQGPR